MIFDRMTSSTWLSPSVLVSLGKSSHTLLQEWCDLSNRRKGHQSNQISPQCCRGFRALGIRSFRGRNLPANPFRGRNNGGNLMIKHASALAAATLLAASLGTLTTAAS